MNQFFFLILGVLALASAGCHPVIATNDNTNFPVMLGPVKRIGMKPALGSSKGEGKLFLGEAGLKSDFTSTRFMPKSAWDSSILSEIQDCNDCTIVVNEIGFESRFFKLLFPITGKTTIHIKGRIVPSDKNDAEGE